MAGPGGGPPRRSHTKSRNGCETCKRRHIRCDENFPQCRNCTKHKSRCPYNDNPSNEDASEAPDGPNLMWTEDIEREVKTWKETGQFPFPALGIYHFPDINKYSVDELRLIFHVASICDQFRVNDVNSCTIWTRQMPTILNIGATHDFVMQAVLALSAVHIADLTGCPQVGNMAYVHRGHALSGMHQAIGSFSQANADAALAASMVLSWQVTEWRALVHVMQGTTAIINSMHTWKHTSQFAEFIAERTTCPQAPPSPGQDVKPTQPTEEDLEALRAALVQLQKVEAHLKQTGNDTKHIVRLSTFLKGSRKVNPCSTVVEQFDRLHPMRTWLFFLPVALLQNHGDSPSSLVVIAHYYAAALLMERLFPEIGAAFFGRMCLAPIEEIAKRLYGISYMTRTDGDVRSALGTLSSYPSTAVRDFRSRMGWVQHTRTHSLPQYSLPSFTLACSSAMVMAPVSPLQNSVMPCDPYGRQFSRSAEDLSFLPSDPAQPPSHGSPFLPASPFAPQAYLNIPSPSFGAPSPASTTFGDPGEFLVSTEGGHAGQRSSFALSEPDDFLRLQNDLSLSPLIPSAATASPVLGHGSDRFDSRTPASLTAPQLSSAPAPQLSTTPQLSSSTTPQLSSSTTPQLSSPEDLAASFSLHSYPISPSPLFHRFDHVAADSPVACPWHDQPYETPAHFSSSSTSLHSFP